MNLAITGNTRSSDVFSKLVWLLLCVPLMPVKSAPSITSLVCSGWLTGISKTTIGKSVKISKPHSVEIALDESNSKLRIGKPNVGNKPQPVWEHASFGDTMIYSQSNSVGFRINRTSGSYRFKGSGVIDNKEMEDILILGKCKKKYPILF